MLRDKTAGLDLNLTQDAFREIDGFACRACGTKARVHPDSNWLWGCPICRYSTFSPSIHFCRTEEPAAKTAP